MSDSVEEAGNSYPFTPLERTSLICSPREHVPGVHRKVAQVGIFALKNVFKNNNVGETSRNSKHVWKKE